MHVSNPIADISDQILALSYGISFWIVPALSAAQAVVSAQLGDPTASAWYIPIYTMTVTIAFMICGANSDLFGVVGSSWAATYCSS